MLSIFFEKGHSMFYTIKFCKYMETNDYKPMIISSLVLWMCVLMVFGIHSCINKSDSSNQMSNSSSTTSSVIDNTKESVYKGSYGTEVIICDNGIAYIDGTKGTWTKSSVTIGNRSHSYIQIDLNGYIEQGAICEDKFYYGRNAHFAVKEGWPDGEPLTKSRR